MSSFSLYITCAANSLISISVLTFLSLSSVPISLCAPYSTFDVGRCAAKCLIPIDVDVKCGSDGISYQNIDELECARERCFPDLKLAYDGKCLDFPYEGILPLQGDSNVYSNSIPNTNSRPFPPTGFTLSPEATTPVAPKISKISSTNPKQEYPKIHFHQKEGDETQHGHHGKQEPVFPPYSLIHANAIKPSPEKNVNANAVECNADHCVCDYVLAPVCGTNGVTYGNTCILNCVRKCDPAISYHHGGFCGKIFFPIQNMAFFRILKMVE